MKPDLLLIEEVAEETRASMSTVRFWIAEGKLASVKPGRRRLVRRKDLDAFLSERVDQDSVVIHNLHAEIASLKFRIGKGNDQHRSQASG